MLSIFSLYNKMNESGVDHDSMQDQCNYYAWVLKGRDKDKFKINIPNARKCWFEIKKQYSDRPYHNLDHIKLCLMLLDISRPLPIDYDAILIALLYHDIIYDTHAYDNEEKSFEFAKNHLTLLQCTPEFIERVRTLIMATKHNTVLTDHDEQLIADIDLASLAQDKEVFDSNCEAIREEYSWVPESEYNEKRIAILESFLNKPNIFYFPEFQAAFERKARANILHAIINLNPYYGYVDRRYPHSIFNILKHKIHD